MKLVLPATAPDGADVTLSPIRPLPFDLDRWRDTLVGTRGTRVLARERLKTEDGWWVAVIVSKPEDGGALRVQGFYDLFDRVCCVTLSNVDSLDAARAYLVAATVDVRTDELVALSELWEPA